MDNQQFNQLRFDLQALASDIVNKLEEIRCGIIDVESNLEKLITFQDQKMSIPSIEEIERWFMKKYDVDERIKVVEHSGENVCYFIREYLKDNLKEISNE